MIIVESYPVAVLMCLITMLCWGSWANTQKLASKEWRFQLFYWDYAIGVFLLSLLLAFTMGSTGSGGRGFLADLHQADSQWLVSAFMGGVIFNLSNILLVAAIDIAGLAVAFPVGVGLALCLGVITTYLSNKVGNAQMLGLGVFVWKEFKGAPSGTNKLLAAMFVFYLIGLAILIASKS
jgi:glucose uptake protein